MTGGRASRPVGKTKRRQVRNLPPSVLPRLPNTSRWLMQELAADGGGLFVGVPALAILVLLMVRFVRMVLALPRLPDWMVPVTAALARK